jgi:hypothetical protein
MKKTLVILLGTCFIMLTAKGQNLFFIGEKSFPCTAAITLESNSENGKDLTVLFAKEGETGILVVRVESFLIVEFGQKIIIYLEDGSVITSSERGASEFVDDHVKAIYYLKNDQLNKMKNSDIHTIRYTLIFQNINRNWSASNNGISTKTIANNFYSK